MSNKLILGIGLFIGILLGVVIQTHLPANLGGFPSSTDVQSTNYTEISASAGIQIGQLGIGISQLLKGTGSIIGNAPIIASTTKAFDISVPNAAVGDLCFASAASTTQAYTGFEIVGCSASTTAGFITLLVSNPGATAAVPYPIASSTNYLVVR